MKKNQNQISLQTSVLSAIMAITPVLGFADTETLRATCKIDTGAQTGRMEILSSDNGDEGFLRFKYILKAGEHGDVNPVVSGEFTDNTQDDGVVFLQPGTQQLYVPIEGASPTRNRMEAVAVYLSNKKGVITGLWKAGFFMGDLKCKAKKYKSFK